MKKLLSVEFRIFKEYFLLDATSFNDRKYNNSISKNNQRANKISQILMKKNYMNKL